MPLPSSAFDTTKSHFGGNSIIEFTPSGGTKLTFESNYLDDDIEQEEKALERADAQGIIREVRTVLTKQKQSWKFELIEPKRLIEIFSNALSGRRVGVVTLWLPDPNDAAGKVSLKSEVDFAATLTRDGSIKFGGSDFTKAVLKITSNKAGPVTFSIDVTVP